MKFKLSLLALLCSASSVMAESAPKNIIYMIGDGMGPAYTTAYRYQLYSILFYVVWRTLTLMTILM